MSENDPTQPPTDPATPANSPPAGGASPVETAPPPKRKRRLWLKIIIGLVVALILLVALLPTIVSTGLVRSIVVGKINDRLNGKLEIADWSLGWISGVRVDGVKVTDAGGNEILALKTFDAPVSLIGLARKNFNLHKVVVDGIDFHAVRDEHGTLNFATLAKPAPSGEPSAPQNNEPTPEPSKPANPPSSPAPSAAPSQTKLPDIKGEFVISHCTGTIEDRQAKTTAKLTSLEADVKIPDINQPIEDTLDASIDSGSGAVGKISANGKLLLVKNNVLMTDAAQLVREADIDQKATLSGFDLATIAPFLGSDAGINRLAGVSDGEVTIRFKPSSDADINAMLRLVKLAVGGKALKGDTFAADSLEVNANHIAMILPADAKGVDAARFRTGPTDGSGPISVTLLQSGGSKSTITLFADVSQNSLARLAKNLTPGDSGTIRAAADLDVAHIAMSMPHLFQLNEGLTLKSGRLTEGTTVDLVPDKTALRQTLSITGISGRNTRTQSDVALQPIELNLSASSLGGGGPMPDVRNLKLGLTSAFANASIRADSVDDLTGELHATLQQAQSELGQIIDFKGQQLAGNLDVALSSKGNLLALPSSTGPAHSAAFDVHGSLKDLRIASDKQPPISEPLTQFAVTGQLHGSDAQPVEKLSGLDLTAMAGDMQHPTLDSHITAELAFEKSAGAKAGETTTAMVLQQATIQKLNLDVSQAQQQFGLLPNVKIAAGTGTVTGFAKRNGNNTHTIIQAYLQNLDLQQLADAKSGRSAAQLLTGYTLHLLADATLKNDSTGSQFELTKLDVDDNQKLLAVQKTNAVVQLTTGSGADAKSVGVLDMVRTANASIVAPSLATLDSVLDALSPAPQTQVATGSSSATPAPAKPKAKITAGSATIALSVSHADGQLKIAPRVNVSSDLAIAAGSASQVVGPIDLTADIAITPSNSSAPADAKAPAPGLMEQIKQLDIANLSAHAVGTEIALKQPLHVTDVAGLTRLIPTTQPAASGASGPPSSLSVALLVKGDIAPLAHLLETLDAAAPGSEYPYTGAFQLDETVGTANGNMTVKGQGDVTQFVLHNGNAVSFSESDIHLANDVGLESGGNNLKIGDVSLAMQSSKALALAVKGELLDLAKQRTFQGVTADLTYDAGPLWKIILPMLSKDSQEKFKDAVVSGKFTKHFAVSGSFPAEGAINERMKNLSASGGLELGVFQGQGIDLQKLNVPIFMKNGKLFIANSDKPGDYAPPASMNGGTLSLSGVTVDLSDPHRTLSMNPNSQIMKNVGLNTALSHLLGEDTGNLLFAGAGGSTGIMNVTIEKCDQVPTDDTMKQNVPSNKGTLAMDVSIQDLSLTGGTLGKILDAIGPVIQVVAKGQSIATGSIKGSVKNYKITLAHGITTHDMTVTLGEHQRSMHLASTVDLLKLQLKDTFLTLPVSLFGISDDKWPNGINLALTGSATAPKFDAVGAVQKSVLSGGGNPLDLINNAIGGKKKGAKGGSTDSSGVNNNGNDDAINAIEGLLGGKKKKPAATQPKQ